MVLIDIATVYQVSTVCQACAECFIRIISQVLVTNPWKGVILILQMKQLRLREVK